MKIICECGNILDSFEIGVNDSLYIECDKCEKYAYNIIQSELNEDGEIIN